MPGTPERSVLLFLAFSPSNPTSHSSSKDRLVSIRSHRAAFCACSTPPGCQAATVGLGIDISFTEAGGMGMGRHIVQDVQVAEVGFQMFF